MTSNERSDIAKHPFGITGVFFVGLFCLLPGLAFGQTKVTFRLDLSQEIAQHFFRPDSDTVELLGDIPPLSMKKGLSLQQSGNTKGLYSVTVQFPQPSAGKILTFKYALRLNDFLQPENDEPARRINLNPGKRLLPVTHFKMQFELFESRILYSPRRERVQDLHPTGKPLACTSPFADPIRKSILVEDR